MSELSSKYPTVSYSIGKKMGLTEDEWEKLTSGLGRDPNEIECAVVARLWSDDCTYRRGRMFLRGVYRESPGAMILPGRRAAMFNIGFDEKIAVSFDQVCPLIEFDPATGIVTGFGRCVDELAALGVEPLSLLMLVHVGDSDDTRNREVLNVMLEAATAYSRKIGIPLTATDSFFNARYNLHPLAACAAVGLSRVERSTANLGSAKKIVLYIGCETRREGPFNEFKTPIVDPYCSTLLKEILRNGYKTGELIEAVHLGVGGLARGAFDLATQVGSGIKIFLNQVPTMPAQQSPKALQPLEILLSETTARYLAVVDAAKYRDFSEALLRYGLNVTQIGEVLNNSEIEFDWNHQALTLIPYPVVMEDLVERSYQLSRHPPMLRKDDAEKRSADIKEAKRTDSIMEDLWIDLLANPNVHMRSRFFEKIDYTSGRAVLSKEGSSAAVIRIPNSERNRALVLSLVSTPRYGLKDPYLGAVHSVAKGMRGLACMGVLPVMASQSLFAGDPNDYRQLSEFSEVVRGASDSCRAWEVPILTDSVRFAVRTNPPIPTAGMLLVGVMNDDSKIVPQSFKNKGDNILILGAPKEELGESELYSTLGKSSVGAVPDIDFDLERKSCDCILELVQRGLLSSVHPVAQGGLAVSLAECALQRDKPIGFKLSLEKRGPDVSNLALLFGESSGRFIISFDDEHTAEISQIIRDFKVSVTGEGTVGGKLFHITGAFECEVPVTTAERVWSQ